MRHVEACIALHEPCLGAQCVRHFRTRDTICITDRLRGHQLTHTRPASKLQHVKKRTAERALEMIPRGYFSAMRVYCLVSLEHS